MEEDTTTVTITVRNRDEERFVRLVGRKPDHRDDLLKPNLVELTFHECDRPECEKFHFEGIPFTGYHDRGDWYGPCRMCGDGTTCLEKSADQFERLYVLVDEATGLPDPKSSESVRSFIEFERQCRQRMDAQPDLIPAA